MMMQGQVNVAFSTSHELHEGPNSGQSNESRQWSNRNRCRKSSSAPFRTKPLALMSVTSKRHWHMQKMHKNAVYIWDVPRLLQDDSHMTVMWVICHGCNCSASSLPDNLQARLWRTFAELLRCQTASTATHSPRWLETAETVMTCTKMTAMPRRREEPTSAPNWDVRRKISSKKVTLSTKTSQEADLSLPSQLI